MIFPCLFKIKIHLFVIQIFFKRQYDDSPIIKCQKVAQLPCNYKISDKKSNSLKKIFSEMAEKMNDESVNLTEPFQLNDSEPINIVT